jgi:heme exporter protein D
MMTMMTMLTFLVRRLKRRRRLLRSVLLLSRLLARRRNVCHPALYYTIFMQ